MRLAPILERLGVRHPIVLGPMGGGISTPELVAAVSNEGALGSLGAAYMSPDEIHAAIREVRRRTDRPFNVNLFAGGREGGPADAGRMLALLAKHAAALGLPAPAAPAEPEDPFAAQAEAVLEERVPVFSFTFGVPPARVIERFHAQGTVVFGTATTVEEAIHLRGAGVDAIVAQGSEAGAHRGTFLGRFEQAMIGTLALVPQVRDAVPDVPVIAAGGVMDGRGVVAALALGAAAAQLGTAFLSCDEAAIPEVHKAALNGSPETATTVTRAFTGRPARCLENAFVRDVEAASEAILPFPRQHFLTRDVRRAAARAGDRERLALWAGQGVRSSRRLPAAELVRRLVAETDATLAALGALIGR